MNARIPPSNLEAEQKVLGALLQPKFDVYPEVGSILAAEHFADPVHGFIFKEIKARIEAGYPEDELRIEIEGGNVAHDVELHLEEVGGSRYLLQLASGYSDHPQPVVPCADIVRHAYLGRVTIDMAEDIINRGHVLLDLALAGTSTEGAFANLAAAQEDVREACRLTPTADDRFAAAMAVEIVDGNVVDMRQPYVPPPHRGDIAIDSDLYGELMLMKTTLDREEVLILSEFHHAAHKRATVLVRTGEREHHRRRGTHFSDALLDLDPMDPPHPNEDGKMEWDL